MTAPTELPQISSPMPWHGQDWAQLFEQVENEQLPHALLLFGEQHSGLSQLVLALARLLLCAQPEGSLNCGHCHACALSASGAHGDFRWIEPGEKSRVIKVDQIRDAVQFSNQTAAFGLRKVIVLAPADNMNLNAYNALLKSLEEPTANTYWILVCHRMFGVPATIRSRCQIQRLAMPDEVSTLNWLNETTGNREKSQELLSLSEGRPLLAQQLYLDGSSKEFALRRSCLGALLAGRITVPEAESMWEDVDIDTFLQSLAEELQRLSSTLPLERLKSRQGQAIFRLMEEVFRLQRTVNSGVNPSKQLLVETTLLKIRRELGGEPLGDTISTQTRGVGL